MDRDCSCGNKPPGANAEERATAGHHSESFDIQLFLLRADPQSLFSNANGLCRPSNRCPSSFANPQKTTSSISWTTTMMSLLATIQ